MERNKRDRAASSEALADGKITVTLLQLLQCVIKIKRSQGRQIPCDLFFYFSKGFCYTSLGVAISFLVSSVHVVPLQVDSC